VCHIAFYGPAVPVHKGHLRNAAEVNDEGFGYAIATDGKLITGRSMDPGLIERFAAERALYPEAPAVWHARLSTGSAVTEDHLHPVAVDEHTLIAHNGHLPFPSLPAHESDTLHFAVNVFPSVFSDLDDEATFETLHAWATPGNKMVVLTVDPRYRESAYVVHRDQFMLTDYGALMSNADHLGKGAGWDEETDENGDLWRWNVPGRTRLRNETQRRARVAAATERVAG
jgi:hypothetical protein